MISQYSQLDLEDIFREVENMRALDKKKYTAKDKIMFEKLKDLQEKYNYFDKKLEEMADNEQATRDLIGFFIKLNLNFEISIINLKKNLMEKVKLL